MPPILARRLEHEILQLKSVGENSLANFYTPKTGVAKVVRSDLLQMRDESGLCSVGAIFFASFIISHITPTLLLFKPHANYISNQIIIMGF